MYYYGKMLKQRRQLRKIRPLLLVFSEFLRDSHTPTRSNLNNIAVPS